MPPTQTSPAVARSMPVIMFMRVDFPDPDFPTTAMNSPASTWRSTPRSARNDPASVT